MIKGVNHRVVEVSDTDSDYFEKIMFFVRPEYAGISEGKIRERAGVIAKSATAPPKNKVIQKSPTYIIGTILGCICSVALGILIGRIF